MEQMIDGSFYEFLDNDERYLESDTVPMRIIKGPYIGLEFRFNRVTMTADDDNLNVNFDVDFLKVPEGQNISLADQKVVDFMGEVLYDIMVNRADINTEINSAAEPVDLEADVHEEPNGKDHS